MLGAAVKADLFAIARARIGVGGVTTTGRKRCTAATALGSAAARGFLLAIEAGLFAALGLVLDFVSALSRRLAGPTARTVGLATTPPAIELTLAAGKFGGTALGAVAAHLGCLGLGRVLDSCSLHGLLGTHARLARTFGTSGAIAVAALGGRTLGGVLATLFLLAATLALVLGRGVICRHAIGVDARQVGAKGQTGCIVHVGGLAHQGLDIKKLGDIGLGHEGERPAFLAGAARTANAMDVVGGLLGNIEVDDVAHIGNVDAAREDVGCHENLDAAVTECREGALALALAAIAVDGLARKAAARKATHAGVGAALGAHEHDHALRALFLEDLGQKTVLLVHRDGHHVLVDGIGSGSDRGDLHASGLMDQIGNGAHALLVERGREQKRLTLLAALAHNSAHLGQKAHIEHAVGLVQHEHAHLVEVRGALLGQVHQASRRRHQNVAAAGERLLLRTVAQTAHDGHGRMTGALGNGGAHLVDLLGELARRSDDEHQRAAAASGVATATATVALFRRGHHVAQLRHGGQQEGCRLAGARLRCGQDVAAGKHLGDRGCLHGRRGFVAHVGDGLHHGVGKTEVGKADRRLLLGRRVLVRLFNDSRRHEGISVLSRRTQT